MDWAWINPDALESGPVTATSCVHRNPFKIAVARLVFGRCFGHRNLRPGSLARIS